MLLPHPEAPTMPTDSPLLILRLMLRSAGFLGLLAYAKETSLNSMMAAASFSFVGTSLAPVEVLMGGWDLRRSMMWFAAECAFDVSSPTC